MRRTVGAARLAFDEIEGSVSPAQRAEWEALLRNREVEAQSEVASYMDARSAEADELRTAALRELTSIRDEADEARVQIAAARISASTFAKHLTELRTRQETADSQLEDAEAMSSDVDAAEEDPIGWFDALLSRTPTLMPDWPW